MKDLKTEAQIRTTITTLLENILNTQEKLGYFIQESKSYALLTKAEIEYLNTIAIAGQKLIDITKLSNLWKED